MFYDHELGEATYSSPAGEINGTILLKRQYRIRKGNMEYMIESSVTVHDDILQKELCSNADNKMRNIVTTIQREQNRIIRNENAAVFIIQGVAGSGKTSIALHRIAYLLYAQKGQISSKDILIISPNKVFADYISNVLPELGEETVPETSMEQILSNVLDNKYKCQTFFEQVTELLEKPTQDFIKRIQYKASFEFISQLDKFILYMENNYFKATDVKLTKSITIPAEFINEQFKRFHRYPIRQRFEPMTDYILEMMKLQYNQTVSTPEKNQLKKEIKKMFAGNNDLQIYKDSGDIQDTQKPHTGICRFSPFGLSAYCIKWEQRPILRQTPSDRRNARLFSHTIQGDSKTLSVSKNNSWRHFPIRQSLWFFHCRYDSKSICNRRNYETLQKLSFYF